MSTTLELFTAEDLPGLNADGVRYELVKGELIKMPPAGNLHGKQTMRLSWRLAQYVESNNLGVVYAAETGFKLASNPDTVRGADIAFVSKQRLAGIDSVEGFFPGAPDLAVEVISPGDTYTEVEEKVAEYLESGTLLVWIVNPRRKTVTVYRAMNDITVLTDKDILDGGEVIRGFNCKVSDIFG
jgi:Uma2 family endonuclease